VTRMGARSVPRNRPTCWAGIVSSAVGNAKGNRGRRHRASGPATSCGGAVVVDACADGRGTPVLPAAFPGG